MFNVIGKTVEDSFAMWTILGTPVFSHVAPHTGTKVYKVHVMCEPKDAKYQASGMDLFLDEYDLAKLDAKPPNESGGLSGHS